MGPETEKSGIKIVYLDVPWSGTFQIQNEALSKLRLPEDIPTVVERVDVEKKLHFTKELDIENVPTIIFSVDGQEMIRFVGVYGVEELQEKLDIIAKNYNTKYHPCQG